MLRCASKQKTSVELVSFLAFVSTCIICIHEKWNHHYRSFIFAMTLQRAGRSACGILLGHIIMYKQYQLFLLKCNNTRSVSLSKYQYITHTHKNKKTFLLYQDIHLCVPLGWSDKRYHCVGPIAESHSEEGLWQLHQKKAPHILCVWQHNLDRSTWWPLLVGKLCKTAQCLLASAPQWTHCGGFPVFNMFCNNVMLKSKFMYVEQFLSSCRSVELCHRYS